MSYTPETPESILSVVNSTSTPLASGATFTGTAELNVYPDVMITVKSDTNGTIYTDFSPDARKRERVFSYFSLTSFLTSTSWGLMTANIGSRIAFNFS